MELYHVLNRGVDKRKIAMDDRDRLRFVRNLHDMNDNLPVFNTSRKPHDIGRQVYTKNRRERELLVSIHSWCLMNNHYHLLLSEEREGGISKFLQKLNMGYSKYFNERHKRVGALFQGKTKKILIQNDSQFLYILHYIHLNPLDYLEGAEEWRVRNKRGIRSYSRAVAHLNAYRWSSYHDYAGNTKFPGITTTSFMNNGGDLLKEMKRFLAVARKDLHAEFE